MRPVGVGVANSDQAITHNLPGLPHAYITPPLGTLSQKLPRRHKKMANFTFVVTDNKSGKVKVADRGLVRKRCMEGKNTQPNSRRSLGARRRTGLSSAQVQENKAIHDKANAKGVGTDLPPANDKSYQTRRVISTRDSLQDQGLSLDWELTRFTRGDTTVWPRELANTSKYHSTSRSLSNHGTADAKIGDNLAQAMYLRT